MTPPVPPPRPGARRLPVRLLTHGVTLLVGLVLGTGLGIYWLPILMAPPPPTEAQIGTVAAQAAYKVEMRGDLKGNDLLHWAQGELLVGPWAIALRGSVAPGPDYRLYLSPTFVQTAEEFEQHRSEMVQVGQVRTFDNFVVTVPATADIGSHTTVVIWCEAFGKFIGAARYRDPDVAPAAPAAPGAPAARQTP
ncbi:DM13 domain-containing protein [uncultured Pseudacidovorax sp.]|uniref:DM13 domain-containing protein n=1 Tax=uncultured Pseudacidovorax sp. TaxID=679313 RepID=UPI0025FF4077|nr:DM13 domain-containing protein [uncultured Pseudacidovorax sp.]